MKSQAKPGEGPDAVDRFSLRFQQPSLGIENVNFKTSRASEFLAELSAQVASFCEANTYELRLEGDPEEGYLTLPLLIPAVPHQFGLLAADFCICLRSSLDYLVWQLALLQTKTPQRLTAFPVSEKKYASIHKFLKDEKRYIGDIGREAGDLIWSLQPNQAAGSYEDSLLWRLNKLSNIAKHRAIPAHSTRRKLDLEAPPGVSRELAGDNLLVLRGPAALLRELKHVPISTVDVLFGEWPDGIEATTEDLAVMHDYIVNDVLPRFAGFFPSGR